MKNKKWSGRDTEEQQLQKYNIKALKNATNLCTAHRMENPRRNAM
jgi:hypothetical protein